MKNILFLGAGRMATAIAGGMVNHGFDAGKIVAFDIMEQAAAKFTESTGVFCETQDVSAFLGEVETVLIAVKPQFLAAAVTPYKELLKNKFIISIAAGVSIEKLHSLTGSDKIVRVMPNTPALVGKGCAAYAASEKVSVKELDFVKSILNSVGISFQLQEKLIDAVTALSGSGPAYVFEFADAMAEGGALCGLPRELALQMSIATLEGAAEMLKKTQLPPAVLKDQVTSPGGTTMKALEVLNQGQFYDLIVNAVKAAEMRSKELGRNI